MTCARFSPVLIAIFAALLPAEQARAQSWLYPESIEPITPLLGADSLSTLTFMPSLLFWGEFGYYVYDSDNDHRWNITIGGTSQLLQGVGWDLVHETSVHLAVDPNNNMAFNPRAFMWETGLLAGFSTGEAIWQFGYQHRCKHDVDNIELYRASGREEQRALIYGSALLRWRHDAVAFGGGKLDPLAEAHYYVLLQDQRFPEWTRTYGPSVTAFIGALYTRQSFSVPAGPSIRLGVTADVRATLLGASSGNRFSSIDRIRIEPAVELHADLVGSRTSMRIYLRYVHQPDDFIPPVPRGTHLVAAGIRLIPSR